MDIVSKELNRCPWCGDDPLYVKYHDEEWRRLVTDDHTLFEFLTLESAQAGLAWITILRKREGYREASHNFDVEKVAAMTEDDVERIMKFDGIVRNRRKIQSAISNAQLFIEIQKEFGSFFNYLRSFFHGDFPIVNHPATMADIPVTSPESDAIAKDMKKRGFKFFGSTICYAYLQATGFVDDHLDGCRAKQNATN
ncbi:MAG: DNA-3-methyladenine glycosylase I [Muribaculaceae bacterium]|nr:DNA-3-methyladenine glycosylase I [Muribaculaceae bacterium]